MSLDKTGQDDTTKKDSFNGKDVFKRTSVDQDGSVNCLCQFEDILKTVTTLFIIPTFDKKGLPELGFGDCPLISYDVLNEAGARLFILSQCSRTSSGFEKSSKDPLLYILSNSRGNELMTVFGQFTLCFGYICGTGVKIYVGDTLVGSVSKHMHSIYIVRDDKRVKSYVLNQAHAHGHQVSVEYIYDNLVAADIASGRLAKDNIHNRLSGQNVFSIHFDREAQPCPEAKALIIGVAVVLFHDNYRGVLPTVPVKQQPEVDLTRDKSNLAVDKSKGSIRRPVDNSKSKLTSKTTISSKP